MLIAAAILAASCLLITPQASFGGQRERLQLGGAGGTAWGEAGTTTFVDLERRPGSLSPLRADPSQNLAPGLLGRGGTVSTTSATEAIPTDWPEGRFQIIDGDSTTAFVHEPQINIYGGAGTFYTVDMRFDLGAPFPVERMRLRTRPSGTENLLRVYRLWVNDGSPETQNQFGDPLWTLVRDELDNLNAVIDLDVEPQVIRYIRLRPWTADVTWEIAEFEVFGDGYVPRASFVSTPIDLGASSTLGTLRWAGQRDEGAKIVIQTRTGADPEPELYWRKTGIGDQETFLAADGDPLTEEDYRFLPPSQKGRITQDLENWSVWSTYDYADGLQGTPMLSPSPNRFVQVRIDFFSDGPRGGRIDSLDLDFSQPPVARQVIAEIWPPEAEPATTRRFTYAVRSRFDGSGGFDVLHLQAPALIDSVVAVRIDRAPVTFGVSRAGDGDVSITFPRITQDQTLLEVEFDAQIFRFGSIFSGRVGDSASDDIPLTVVAGDAVPQMPGRSLSVSTGLQGSLLAAVRVRPNPFSPNGDGINDAVRISFAILRLTRQVPVSVEIRDLSGRRVRDLSPGAAASGPQSVTWDGRDEAGRRVPPGLYLYRLAVEGKESTQVRTGTLAVAY